VKKLALTTLVVALLAGCPAPDPTQGLQTTQPDQFLDYNAFVCNVMPTLVNRCSYLACHGNPDHALRVYSPGKLRLVPTATRHDRDAAMTPDEVERNFESASGIVLSASPADRNPPNWEKVLIMGKPLKAAYGGAEHHGVGIFPVPPYTDPGQDPEFKALASWVSGAKEPTPLGSSCAAIFTALKLTPR
jgi:hypothetical protein